MLRSTPASDLDSQMMNGGASSPQQSMRACCTVLATNSATVGADSQAATERVSSTIHVQGTTPRSRSWVSALETSWSIPRRTPGLPRAWFLSTTPRCTSSYQRTVQRLVEHHQPHAPEATSGMRAEADQPWSLEQTAHCSCLPPGTYPACTCRRILPAGVLTSGVPSHSHRSASR